MKKIILSLIVVVACFMVACGNAEVDKINQLVIEATQKTKEAKSAPEVAEIAMSLQAEMDKINAEAGGKLTIGKSVEASLAKYQEAAAAKFKELGIEKK